MHIYTYIKHLSYLGMPTSYSYLIVLCFTICSVIFNITLACNSDQASHNFTVLCERSFTSTNSLFIHVLHVIVIFNR